MGESVWSAAAKKNWSSITSFRLAREGATRSTASNYSANTAIVGNIIPLDSSQNFRRRRDSRTTVQGSRGRHGEWDPTKAVANRKKHGVSFPEATSVFGDPLSITISDPEHSDSEARFDDLGLSHRGRPLVVSYILTPA